MNALRFIVLLFFLAILCSSLSAQERSLDQIVERFNHYSPNLDNSVLFVHFDKTEYNNFEKVYFTGYLIQSLVNISMHKVLYLSVVRNKDNLVVYQNKFLIENGFSFGSFKMPDTVTSGNYRFVVNTDIKVNDHPELEFIQPIIIKSLYVDPIVPTATVFKEMDEKTGEGSLLFKAMTNNFKFVDEADVEYNVLHYSKVVENGKFKTNSIGEAIVNYPYNLANRDSTFVDFKISKYFKAEEDKNFVLKSSKISRNLRFQPPRPKTLFYKMNFYPEGGYLIENLISKVGVELKDSESNLINGFIVVYENDKPIDTIKTNSRGLGFFMLQPLKNNTYVAKLLDEKISKQAFKLPDVLNGGVVLKVENAVVDSVMYVNVQLDRAQKLYFLIHNYKNIFATEEIYVTNNKPLLIKFQLKGMPIGLNTLTVLNREGKPLAERMFFANYGNAPRLNIDLDTLNFKTRDRVNLQLSIIDSKNKLLDGVVSIACVKTDKISGFLSKNISDYVYLDNNLDGLATHPSGFKMGDKDYLEDVLLIKYWRRYKWTENAGAVDSGRVIGEYVYTGQVFNKTKKVPGLKELAVISNGNWKTMETNRDGFFTFRNTDLLKTEEAKLVLTFTEKRLNDIYSFRLDDPLDKIKQGLYKTKYSDEYTRMNILNENVQNKINFNGIKLKDVTILKSKSASTDDYFLRLMVNKCGDYVCSHNILNCENHVNDFENILPIAGVKYLVRSGEKISEKTYSGCNEWEEKNKLSIQLVQGINLPKEFYVSDVNNKNEPINFQTIYWNYQSQLNTNQKTPLSFYNGDLTGSFKIIVQGMTEHGFVYGEKEFVVNK